MVPPVEGVAGGGTAYGWSDTGIHEHDGKLMRSIDPMKVPTSELIHIWCMPSTANVGAEDMPRSLEPISLLAARNEGESIQIALRPKFSWSGSNIPGTVHIQCADLCSTSGDRLTAGQSLTLHRVVSILGVPHALVPLDMPTCHLNLLPGSAASSLTKAEKHQLYRQLRNCLEVMEPIDGEPTDEVLGRVKSAASYLRMVLVSPSFLDCISDTAP